MSPDDYTEKIELLVNDENRIVTYKCLSHELKIHVNKAKQCLMDYFNAQKLKGISLEVHYFLAGFIEKDGLRAVKVLIVSDDKLEKAKEGFIELTSSHIYSIYKGTSKDECALYSADFIYTKDKKEQSNFRYSAIKHPNIEIQPPVLNRMQTTNDVKMNVTKKVESQAATNGSLSSGNSKLEAKAKPSDSILPEKNDVKSNETKDSKENKSSPDGKKQKPGTLMSMWQKKDQPNDVKKENSKPEAKGKGAAKNVPKNNILSMFSKQAVKNAEKPPVPKPPEPKVENSKMEVDEVRKNNAPKNVSSSESKKSSQKRKMTNKHSKASKLKHDSESENDFKSKPKKHRRICTFDSSSESEPEEEKEKAQRSFFLPEEPLDAVEATTPMSDDEEPIPPTPPVVHVKGKAKVWKTVQKNYEDEDGFFVTKKEKELVSASEDEEDPLKTSTVKNEEVSNKKTPPTVNKKQSSLMSFFKQK